MKKDIPVFSLDLLHRTGSFTDTTIGYALAYRFCNDVEKTGKPSDEDLKAVAHALRAIIEMRGKTNSEIMDEVAERLGTKKKQGQERTAEGTKFRNATLVAQYLVEVEKHINQGVSRKKAEIAARVPFCEKLGIGDRRFRDMIREHREIAEALLKIL
ncbi:hypothetical protein JVX99_21340 [Pseudomonas aeruginosa]|uniref:hypothetical protein n=1 Tax=Pseudomonas aeruginosa TaxID=287 RepID=UPI000F51FEFB|nr:hypothetical protein [Pseudomonas aeruginosa]EIU1611195.1 hypothetical protein [Pseudomonas aeruginosa]EIU1616000.1 hypothetical protein [Pseudomonas aeruginosa]EKU1144964.1 hypothetical protein [Pseudomonas aeruginosa]EKU1915075.1 hypothetical protein [Pseudomonas aeruginosa]EKU1971287.1 hypothetical protein [Pseudomonas aeruginosa]